MSRIVGIDLGTTNSAVATVDSGIPLVIADADGQRLTPSVVHFPGANAEPILGHKANRVRVLKPSETVVFSWIVYKSRAHRDSVNAKVMKDPRMKDPEMMKSMPFDMNRFAVAGFKVLVNW